MASKKAKKEKKVLAVSEEKVLAVSEEKSSVAKEDSPKPVLKKVPTFIRMITPCITARGDFSAGQVLEADEDLQNYFKENAICFEKLN